MFNFGFSELIVIGVIALVFIGPKQLPEVARVVGRLLNEFKRATGDITGSFVNARDEADNFLRNAKDKLHEELEQVVAVDDEEEKKEEPQKHDS